ncbi:MAG: 6-phosphofructokinase [Chitinophagales bacterium]
MKNSSVHREDIHIDGKPLVIERDILKAFAERKEAFPSVVKRLKKSEGKEYYHNPRSEKAIGFYRNNESQILATADYKILKSFQDAGLPIPVFLEAGPREMLHHSPSEINVAIVTTGGLAPGLNAVVHAIVKRHCKTYGMSMQGNIWGIRDGFKGLLNIPGHKMVLNDDITSEWLNAGGSKLGCVRYAHKEGMADLVEKISDNLESNRIRILYVIGGDGSQEVAHAIAHSNKKVSVIGLPKTMDNDVLWANPSFGFNTAVGKASHIIEDLHTEAKSTRRIGIIQFFGAESGFVAAFASLANGQVNTALIPEAFAPLSGKALQKYWDDIIEDLRFKVTDRSPEDHALIVVAEGVAKVLEDKKFEILGERVDSKKGNFIELFQKEINLKIKNSQSEQMSVFTNEPRHNIRSVPPDAFDQIHCELLGSMAVDAALAGFTDCMPSKWLDQYVLVPLELVIGHQKGIDVKGLLWKTLVNSIAQPHPIDVE